MCSIFCNKKNVLYILIFPIPRHLMQIVRT